MSTTKASLSQAAKDALKNKEKERLSTIRMALSAIKQVEVDERIEVPEDRVLAILDKMIKQRKESAAQFKEANRTELADKELSEIKVLQAFLPQALSTEEVSAMIEASIQETSASSIKDMGKVMAILKPKLQGRADIGQASALVKKKLT